MDELPFTRALYLACVNCHSGQWSRGYRLQCQLQSRMARHYVPWPERESDLDPVESDIYARIVSEYAHYL